MASLVPRATTAVIAVESGPFELMRTQAASQVSTHTVLVGACNSYKASLAQVKGCMEALLKENGSLKARLIVLESNHKQYETATTAAMKALEEENAKCKAFLQEKEEELAQVRGENVQLKESITQLKKDLKAIQHLARHGAFHNLGGVEIYTRVYGQNPRYN